MYANIVIPRLKVYPPLQSLDQTKWNIYQRNLKQKHKEEKRHYCEKCDVAFKSPYDLRTHLNTRKHKGISKGCISDDKVNSVFRFRWSENGKRRVKSFSYKRSGNREEAMRLAEEFKLRHMER